MPGSPHVVTAAGNFVVVTQVISSPQGAGSRLKLSQETKSRIEAAVLGALQINFGLTFLMIQIVSVSWSRTLGLITGAIVWGPLSFITSGSLTVWSGTGSSISRVKISCCFSSLSVLTSGVAIGISVLDAAEYIHYWQPCYDYPITFGGLYVILVVVSVAEFIVAILSCSSMSHLGEKDQIITNHRPQEGAPERTGTLPSYEAPPTGAAVYESLPTETSAHVAPTEQPTNQPPPNSYETVKPDDYNTYLNNPAYIDGPPPPGSLPVNQTHELGSNRESVNI